MALGVLSACGGNESVTTADSESLQVFFEANPWEIIERTGFDTTPVDGLVIFETYGSTPGVVMRATTCPWSGNRAIEWDDEGYTLLAQPPPPEDPNEPIEEFNVPTGQPEGDCGPEDDLLLRFLTRGGDGGDRTQIEISEDRSSAVLTKGSRTITLSPMETTVS